MSGVMQRKKQGLFRNTSIKKRWQFSEEIALVNFIKENRNLERPSAWAYYTKFLFESGIENGWKHVRSKVRNMRVAYRKAKEQEIKNIESNKCNVETARSQTLKSCWFVDDFDILFPNEMDKNVDNCSNQIIDDEFYKDESISNSSTTFKSKVFDEEESTTSSVSKSIDEDMTEQNKVLHTRKKKKRDDDTNIKEQEHELTKKLRRKELEHFCEYTNSQKIKSDTPLRNRLVPVRKWQRKEEMGIIDFLKINNNFEQPTSQTYYTKFILESEINIDWKRVRAKVRNMRVLYRKAKQIEISNAESNNDNIQDVKTKILKICWYVDDFDIIFPNEMDYITKNQTDPIFDDELWKDDFFYNAPSNFFHQEEESTTNSFSKSIYGDLTGKEKGERKTNIKQPEPELSKKNLNCVKENVREAITLNEIGSEKIALRKRTKPVRKWQHNEELAIIDFLKQNRDFEKPTGRVFYTKFIFESGIDVDWKRVRSKVRNMRVAYRKAKEYEAYNAESNTCDIRDLRNQILKICWYVDDFDIIFPNDLNCLIYKRSDSFPTNELSNDGNSVGNFNNNFIIEELATTNLNNKFLLEEDSTTSSFSETTNRDIFTVQSNLFNLKNQQLEVDSSIKQQELELAKEKLNFEKEKLRQEIKLKEKEIEIEEKLKVMELQMKERIAIKELEIEEKLAFRSEGNREIVYNNIYHNLA